MSPLSVTNLQQQFLVTIALCILRALRLCIGCWFWKNNFLFSIAFIKDYNRIRPRSQYAFSKKKRPDTRSWQTVAAYYNTRSWRKLLSTLNLPLYNALHRERVPQKITVAIHHDYDFRE